MTVGCSLNVAVEQSAVKKSNVLKLFGFLLCHPSRLGSIQNFDLGINPNLPTLKFHCKTQRKLLFDMSYIPFFLFKWLLGSSGFYWTMNRQEIRREKKWKTCNKWRETGNWTQDIHVETSLWARCTCSTNWPTQPAQLKVFNFSS